MMPYEGSQDFSANKKDMATRDRPADNLFVNRTILTDGHLQLHMIDSECKTALPIL